MTRGKSPERPESAAPCDDCGGGASDRNGDGLRCACGRLLARYVDGGVELMCRRCKRTVVVPVSPQGGIHRLS